MITLVEKLEKLEKEFIVKARNNVSSIMKLTATTTAIGVHKAIDIVKQHKCTWQGTVSESKETIYYALSCGKEYFDDCMSDDAESFTYCPFCGGEIEFSEVQP